jgi:hypothetical protein
MPDGGEDNTEVERSAQKTYDKQAREDREEMAECMRQLRCLQSQLAEQFAPDTHEKLLRRIQSMLERASQQQQ